MAHDKNPKSIFEAAGSKNKKSDQKSEEKSTLTSFEEIFSRCQKMHEEIVDTLEKNLQRSKVTPSALRSYISHPQNFSQQEWQSVEEQKKKNEKMLEDLTQKVSRLQPSEKPKKRTKKGKKKVVTKRRWLKMG